MTAPHARQPQVLPRPACTPTAIRAVLACRTVNPAVRTGRARRDPTVSYVPGWASGS
jgi:hypothetical protein